MLQIYLNFFEQKLKKNKKQQQQKKTVYNVNVEAKKWGLSYFTIYDPTIHDSKMQDSCMD